MSATTLPNGAAARRLRPHAGRPARHRARLEGGAVTWTGDDDAAEHFADGADRVVDLAGRLVTPAFVDSHVHLAQTGFALAGARPDRHRQPARTRSTLLASPREPLVRRGAARLRLGRDRLARAAAVHPARSSTGPPAAGCVLPRPGRRALRRGLHRVPRRLPGGRARRGVRRRPGWSPATRTTPHALGLFRLVPAGDREGAILRALQDAARQGIGMVHELGAPHISPAEDFAVIAALATEPPLPEVVGYWGELDGRARPSRSGCAGAAGDLCMDGAIGSRTAALHTPYADADDLRPPLPRPPSRSPSTSSPAPARASRPASTSSATGPSPRWWPGFEAAAEVVGATGARAGAAPPRARRDGRPGADRRAGRARGRPPACSRCSTSYWGGRDSLYAQRLGADRALPMNAFASHGRAGVALAFGSDTPVTPLGPWAAVRAAAWHHDRDRADHRPRPRSTPTPAAAGARPAATRAA